MARHFPQSAPGRRRRRPPPSPPPPPVVPWVPDSLAERCYHCETAFSLLLRRHHCRRCGNVFCDACSSSRMPLVHSRVPTPVRVCAPCCLAAKKAHAKMVYARQDVPSACLRRYSDTGAQRRGRRHGPLLLPHDDDDNNDNVSMGRRASDAHAGLRLAVVAPRMNDTTGSGSGGRRTAFEATMSTETWGEWERTDRDEDVTDVVRDGRVLRFLLPGEAVLVTTEQVQLQSLDQSTCRGRLYVTNYRLVFLATDEAGGHVETFSGQSEGVGVASRAIPLATIERIKRKEMVETDSGRLDIVAKDFRRLSFMFAGLVSQQTFGHFDRTVALVRLHALGEPAGPVDKFAKFSLERFDGVYGAVDGWRIYNAVTEFERLGLSSSTDRWRFSFMNDEYDLCPTYPSVLAVPSSTSDSVLAVASKFRSKGRIPVLSWRDRDTGAVICRSSQPLVGLGQKQCEKDVFLIQAIAATNPSSSKLVIIDARPWKNAVAQKTVGRAGYELTEHYETRHTTASLKYTDMVAPEHSTAAAQSTGTTFSTFAGATIDGHSAHVNESGEWGGIHTLETIKSSLVLTECKLIFMGIENIHTMRKSYHKLMDLCTTKQSNDKWLDQLASTHWMDHISRILDSAVEIARIVKEQKSSVLIHCSDGWDRTAQLTSLTELLIDPYYRTVVGFQRLIEKEWCSFGHKFRDRTSHGASNSSNESSPVFLQWIDCVWQVLVQFPSAFEFNERYLILILDHLYSCRFGTFLYNSERERMEQEALHPTQSLWSYLSTVDRAIVINPFYRPYSDSCKKWKASVTATCQCFERTGGRSDEESVPAIRHKPHKGSGVHSLKEDYENNERVRDAFDLPDWSAERCNSPTSTMACASDVAVASSPSYSGAGTTNTGVKARSKPKLRRHRSDSNESHLGGNMFNGWDSESETERTIQPARHHKLVRDLDAGFSFPQPFDVSSLSKPPSSPPAAPHSRLSYVDTNAEDGGAGPRALTPKFRSSLTSLFVPDVERKPFYSDTLWNTCDTEAVSEDEEMGRYNASSCDEVIIPSSLMKSLHFWARYYLRWDSSSHFTRDASVELETLHLDLIMRVEALTKQIGITREDEAAKKEHKAKHFMHDPQGRCVDNGCASSSQSPSRECYRRNRLKALGDSTSSQDSSFGAADTGIAGSKNAVVDAEFLEEQIAKLKTQKLQRFEEAERIYEKQLTRLLKASNREPVEFT